MSTTHVYYAVCTETESKQRIAYITSAPFRDRVKLERWIETDKRRIGYVGCNNLSHAVATCASMESSGAWLINEGIPA